MRDPTRAAGARQPPGDGRTAGPAYWRHVRRQKDEIMSVRAEAARRRSALESASLRASRLLAEPAFFGTELLFHVGWVVLNVGVVPGVEPWDPYPFPLLALLASAQALLFALLILMQQTHEARIAELREETDLQVALHTEREATKLLRLVEDIHQALRIRSPDLDEELEEMKVPLDPEQLRDALEERLREADGRPEAGK